MATTAYLLLPGAGQDALAWWQALLVTLGIAVRVDQTATPEGIGPSTCGFEDRRSVH